MTQARVSSNDTKGGHRGIGKVKLHPKGDWKASRRRQREVRDIVANYLCCYIVHGDPISAGVPTVLRDRARTG